MAATASEAEMGRSLEGGVADLISAAWAGNSDDARGIGRYLGQAGERLWLLELLEAVGEAALRPELLLLVDAFRMLFRTAPAEHYPLLGELAGEQLERVLGP